MLFIFVASGPNPFAFDGLAWLGMDVDDGHGTMNEQRSGERGQGGGGEGVDDELNARDIPGEIGK